MCAPGIHLVPYPVENTDTKLRTLSSARRIFAYRNSVQVIVFFLAAVGVVAEFGLVLSETAATVAVDAEICVSGSLTF